jgi:hypothetical protein
LAAHQPQLAVGDVLAAMKLSDEPARLELVLDSEHADTLQQLRFSGASASASRCQRPKPRRR